MGASITPVPAVASLPCLRSGGCGPVDLLVPADTATAVVALFAVEKARLGDVFYDGVAARADPLIDQWKRETAQEEEA